MNKHMNQVMHQDMSICLRSAFPSISSDCLDTLMETVCSVQNTQSQVHSIPDTMIFVLEYDIEEPEVALATQVILKK